MKREIALFHLGFRPFFLGAGIFAVLSVALWMGVYLFSPEIKFNGLTPSVWHAHEMIYGYAMAIIAGFMLTATQNWTGIQTLHGSRLLLLFLLWVVARLIPFTGGGIPIQAMAIIDGLFQIILLVSVVIPIIKAKQWRQLIILTVLLLLLLGNMAFYTGVLINNYLIVFRGVYSGLYLIIALIIVMGGRVIPFFIERGVGYPVQLVNRKWLEILSIALFLVFWIVDIFLINMRLAALLAGALFIIHGMRMSGWYTSGIWKKPLLWSLYLAYGALIAGFALKFAVFAVNISPFLAVHAFGYGCIGLITLGMICRVTWGHTGRNIQEPPAAVAWIFAGMILGTFFRVFMPLIDMQHYVWWVGVSQGLWIISFALFLYVYTPVLIGPRPDGEYG